MSRKVIPKRRPRTGPSLAAVGTVALLAALFGASALSAVPQGFTVAGPLAVHRTPGGVTPSGDGEVNDPGTTAGSVPQLLNSPTGTWAAVPILVYHYIRVDSNPRDTLGINLSVTPTLFAQQMALLRAEGGHPITLADLVGAMVNHTALPTHPVVLTFDDGYADFATAAEPVLARYGFVATDFVVSGFLNRAGFMNADQVRQMDAAGMVIGSHTVNHVDLPSLPLPVAQAEIEGGKAALEALLGHPVLDFAYPYGGVSAAVAQLVQQAGFRDAVTTAGGDVQWLGQRYLLRRTHIGGNQGLRFFAAAAELPQPDAVQLAEAVIASLRPLGLPLWQAAYGGLTAPVARASFTSPPGA